MPFSTVTASPTISMVGGYLLLRTGRLLPPLLLGARTRRSRRWPEEAGGGRRWEIRSKGREVDDKRQELDVKGQESDDKGQEDVDNGQEVEEKRQEVDDKEREMNDKLHKV